MSPFIGDEEMMMVTNGTYEVQRFNQIVNTSKPTANF